MRNLKAELSYLIGYTPSDVIVAEAEEWVERNPTGDISEWIEEMVRIGALR